MLNIRSIIDAVHASLATAETVSQEIINVATEVRSLAHLGGQWTPEDETKLADNVSRLGNGILSPLPAIVPTVLQAIKTAGGDGQPVTPLSVAETIAAHATQQAAPVAAAPETSAAPTATESAGPQS